MSSAPAVKELTEVVRSQMHLYWVTLAISLLALFISAGALVYAYKDDKADEKWRLDQINLLTKQVLIQESIIEEMKRRPKSIEIIKKDNLK